MASRRTWLWIIVGGIAAIVLVLFLIAGAGVYFVANHIDTAPASSAEAISRFEEARAPFKDAKPLFEVDDHDRPRLTRELSSLPTSPTRPSQLWILAYDPDDERTVQISLPFWLLKLGRRNLDINADRGFDLERLHLDVNELERVGPLLLFDHRSTAGDRVLLWTK
ncbi:MAG: hypothetical protein R2752_20755 [Vicinamibacterales bacterium]